MQDQPDGKPHKRQHGKQDGAKPGFHAHGDDQAAKQQDRGPDTQPLHHADHPVQVVGVCGQTGDHGRNGDAVHLGAGKQGGFLVKVPADFLRYIPRHG